MAKKSKQLKTISEQLRQAIEDSGQSIYAIAKGSGAAQAGLQRFYKNGTGLTLESLDRICTYLGLELTKRD